MAQKGRPPDPSSSEHSLTPLRILIADEDRDRLERLAALVSGLGHEVIAREIYIRDVGATVAGEQPDLALVGLAASSGEAVELLGRIVRETACPVVAVLRTLEPAAAAEAAVLGVFAFLIEDDPDAAPWSTIESTLSRFAAYHALHGPFGDRATIEQAKGVLMARHRFDAPAALDLLRDQSRRGGLDLVDVARAVLESHLLLVPDLPARPASGPPPDDRHEPESPLG